MADSVKRLSAKKIDVSIESGAGAGACVSDEDFRAGGATVEASGDALYASSDVILRLRMPTPQSIALLREGSALVSPLFPLQAQNAALVRALAERKVTSIAVDMIPRTTVAQMMDVLSSQATIAGYYAVLMAAGALPKFFPMLMTAAGTIAPARVLVLGAGVAGLQAIGTARRLGAVVEAFDVRRVVKEQVESLGARFVAVESDEDAQTAGGYAKETSDAYKAKQAEAIARHVQNADVVISTALIPGQRAPILVTEDMVKSMRPGSVIVDLAAEQQGNCALTEPGKSIVAHGVNILGELDLPSRVAIHASQMYARNMEKLLLHLCKYDSKSESKDSALHLDPENEITRGCLITHAGDVVHPKVKERL